MDGERSPIESRLPTPTLVSRRSIYTKLCVTYFPPHLHFTSHTVATAATPPFLSLVHSSRSLTTPAGCSTRSPIRSFLRIVIPFSSNFSDLRVLLVRTPPFASLMYRSIGSFSYHRGTQSTRQHQSISKPARSTHFEYHAHHVDQICKLPVPAHSPPWTPSASGSPADGTWTALRRPIQCDPCAQSSWVTRSWTGQSSGDDEDDVVGQWSGGGVERKGSSRRTTAAASHPCCLHDLYIGDKTP